MHLKLFNGKLNNSFGLEDREWPSVSWSLMICDSMVWPANRHPARDVENGNSDASEVEDYIRNSFQRNRDELRWQPWKHGFCDLTCRGRSPASHRRTQIEPRNAFALHTHLHRSLAWDSSDRPSPIFSSCSVLILQLLSPSLLSSSFRRSLLPVVVNGEICLWLVGCSHLIDW